MMVQYTRVNGMEDSDMAREGWIGKMGLVFRASGTMVTLTVEVISLMHWAIYMKAHSICQWPMGKESTLIQRDRLMKASGSLTSKMDKGRKCGVMGHLMKVLT